MLVFRVSDPRVRRCGLLGLLLGLRNGGTRKFAADSARRVSVAVYSLMAQGPFDFKEGVCDLPSYVGLENIYENRQTPQPKANPTQEIG